MARIVKGFTVGMIASVVLALSLAFIGPEVSEASAAPLSGDGVRYPGVESFVITGGTCADTLFNPTDGACSYRDKHLRMAGLIRLDDGTYLRSGTYTVGYILLADGTCRRDIATYSVLGEPTRHVRAA